MFSYAKCRNPECKHFAISDFDQNGNLIESGEFCYAHIADKDEYQRKIYNYIQTHDKIIGLNACGLTFTDIWQ